MSGPETAGTGPHQAPAGLLEKLMAAVRPEFRASIPTLAPGDPVFGLGGACRIAQCGRPARPSGGSLCNNHYDRWAASGRPDLDTWTAGPDAAQPWYGHTPPASCQVSGCRLQYAPQGRADDRTVKVNPVVLRTLVRYLAASGASSLLDRSEQEWRGDPPAASAKQAVALLAYAHRAITTLAEGEGWDAEYPRDTWHLRRLGTGYDTAVLDFTGISQPWLRDLAKRWTRWRMATGRARVTYGAGVRAVVTRLSAFLDGTRTDSPGLLTRDVLERYLADLHRELAGRVVTHRQYVSHVGSLLLDARRHPCRPAGHGRVAARQARRRPRPQQAARGGQGRRQDHRPDDQGGELARRTALDRPPREAVPPADAQPHRHTLRYRIWHLPAKLAAHARRKTLAISADWPWAEAFLTCWQRLCALPAPD